MHFLSRLVHRFSTVATSTSNVGSISTDLYKEKDLKRLVDKFKRYSDLERFRTKTGIYKETVRRLANAKRFRWIEEILEHQKQYKDVSKEGFSVRLVALYGQAGMFDNAHRVFKEMRERNCKQTILSFNALLGACVNSRKFDMVDGLFSDLPKKLGIEPDQVSYNTVVKAYCEMGSLDSAIMLLDDMEKKGVEPDRITFNTLLHAFYMNGRFGAAEMIWERMANRNITPDIRSYNAKLYGLAMEKRTKEAVELVEEMRYKTIKPDVFSFNALIKGFVNEGKLEEAKWWYDEIEKSDCAINKGTFTILVPLVCEKGDLDFAFELCKKIFGRRCLVDEELLQLVLDSLVKESKIEEAKELVELSKTNDYCRYNLKFSSNE
ncbi:pentatricopeptide repeat-containing protein At3g13160, mitochondrial-like isoform X1 [Mangifera indica]|uniref:pentatricopeptide repeat-containing protein At3g13160, mitochondrial-like isoform X1 n=1 Tax=Mangifera indica TaxID=29780 RepID=UPI001CFB6787|nr:pentatricopeptide repeat-containing protein At3g13160, mitochondrial-like isoform X1 [Mangifera indica]